MPKYNRYKKPKRPAPSFAGDGRKHKSKPAISFIVPPQLRGEYGDEMPLTYLNTLPPKEHNAFVVAYFAYCEDRNAKHNLGLKRTGQLGLLADARRIAGRTRNLKRRWAREHARYASGEAYDKALLRIEHKIAIAEGV